MLGKGERGSEVMTTTHRHDTVLEATLALVVDLAYVADAANQHDRMRKIRITYTHAPDKHHGAMIGWIVPGKRGEFRLISRPGGKSRKLPEHIWRIDPIGGGTPYYLCPALRKEESK